MIKTINLQNGPIHLALALMLSLILSLECFGQNSSARDPFTIHGSSLAHKGKLFFLKEYPGDIFGLNLSNGQLSSVLPPKFHQQAGNFDVSRDGKRIVFASKLNGTWDIWMGELNEDKTKVEKTELLISTSGREEDPKFSPDGSKIVYKSNEDIFVYNLRSKSHIQVTKTSQDEEWAPCFSPDGNSLAFTRGTDRTTPKGVIVLVNLKDLLSKNLTSTLHHSWFPAFSSQGDLIFASQREKDCDDDIYFLDKKYFDSADIDSHVTKMENLNFCQNISDADPSLSYADTDLLFYVSSKEGRYGVYVYSLSNKKSQPVINHIEQNLLAPIHIND